MPDRRSPARRRRAAPARDILAGQVRAEELPDVARPAAPAPPQAKTVADPEASASRNAELVNELARSVLEAGRLPLRVTEAALESQARAIDGLVARRAMPTLLVPGAVVLKAQIRFLLGMVRAASASPGGSRRSLGPRGPAS